MRGCCCKRTRPKAARTGRICGLPKRCGSVCGRLSGCARRSKKNALKPHLRRMWCIPPRHSAAFVFHMEDVLAVYHRPHDPQRPVVCLDKCSKQLIGEIRTPLPPCPARDDRPGRAECYDCDYVRNGTANLFMAFEPLGGWREVAGPHRRRREGRARLLRHPGGGRYRGADKLVLVMDQLNIHSPASLY